MRSAEALRNTAPLVLALPALVLASSAPSCALSFSDYGLEADDSASAGGMGGSGGGHMGGAEPVVPEGAPCTANGECLSGHCLGSNTGDGRVCCATACPDMGAESCGTNGKCDASGSDCALYPAETVCGPTSCQDGLLTTPRCHAASCTPGAPIPCPGALACADGSTCKAACAGAIDCPTSDATCDSGGTGTCIQPDGAPCGADAECASGVCGATGTGHCCSSSCDSGGDPCGPVDCDASGACVFAGTETACGSGATCMDANLKGRFCNGEGQCDWQSTQPCPDHLGCASATACSTVCGSNDDTGDALCALGHWCDGSTCHRASWDEGSPCLRDGQCRSNDCTPTGTCAAVDCDFDGDGVLRDAAQCGGTDCDDDDARAYPGQIAFFETPRSTGGYDFDCSGAVEQKHVTSCLCSGYALLVPPGEAGCGVTGPIRICSALFPPIFCPMNTSTDTATQLCR